MRRTRTMAEYKQNNEGNWVKATPEKLDESIKTMLKEIFTDIRLAGNSLENHAKFEMVQYLIDAHNDICFLIKKITGV